MAKKLLIFACIVLFLAEMPFISRAQTGAGAGFVFTPTSGAYVSGSRIVVTVSVDTKGEAINAADATIAFPSDSLKVISISKANSVFKFWVQDPTYSNTDGTITFSGGVPTPGFTGSSGTLLSVTFQALGPGAAKLRVTEGSILANDGLGTNILAFNQEPTYQISAASQSADLPTSKGESSAQAFGVPGVPSFFSRTHSNERAWYASKSFEVSWNLPNDADGVAYALVRDSNYYLPSVSRGLIDHVAYDLSKYKDGTWYFYARLHNKNGWGPTASRAVLMDFSQPNPFAVVRVDKDDFTNPSPALSFNTTDPSSPMSGYTLNIDGGGIIDAAPLKRGNVYVVPALSPGSHLISVRAYDSARNYTDGLLQVDIKPLESPEITSYSYDVSPPQKPLLVSGFVPKYIEAFTKRVVILLRGGSNSDAFEVPINNDGTWTTTISDRLMAGEYLLSAYVTDDRGARSEEVGQKQVKVGGWLTDILASIGEYSIIGTAMIIALGLIIAVAIYFYAHLLKMRKRFFGDVKKLEEKLDSDLEHVEKDMIEAKKCPPGLDNHTDAEQQKHLAGDIETIEKDIKSELDELKNLRGE